MAIHSGKLYPDCAAAFTQYIADITRLIVGLDENNNENNPILSTGFRWADADCNGNPVDLSDQLHVQKVAVGLTVLQPGTVQFDHMVEAITYKYTGVLGFTPNTETGGKDISLQDIVDEFGGTGQHGLSEYYRGGGFVPDITENNTIPRSGPITLEDFYGTTNLFVFNVSENVADMNVIDYCSDQGWNGTSPIRLIVNSGVYVYGDESPGFGMLIPSSNYDIEIINNGYIIGRGGNGGVTGSNGGNGAAAISVQTDASSSSTVIIRNNADGFIAGGGGGGGGGSQAGGGGGAGGGNGGAKNQSNTITAGGAGGAPGESGSNSQNFGGNTQGKGGTAGGSGGGVQQNKGADTVSPGGGGGRVLPGTGVNALLPVGEEDDRAGGYGGGPEQAGGRYSRPYYQNPTTDAGNISTGGGGGGGGWGASGGRGSGSGGSGGRGVIWAGFKEPTIINNGTIYGAYE